MSFNEWFVNNLKWDCSLLPSLPHNPHCTISCKRVQLNFCVSRRGRLGSATLTELSHHPNMAFLNEKKTSTVNRLLWSTTYKAWHLALQYTPFQSLILEPVTRIKFYNFHIIFLIENFLNKETEASKNPAITATSHPLTSYLVMLFSEVSTQSNAVPICPR